MRALVLILCAIVVLPVMADKEVASGRETTSEPAQEFAGFGLAEFPKCQSHMGMDVQFIPMDHATFNVASRGKSLAAATGSLTPNPVVMVDAEVLNYLQIPFQKFVYFHECAHHAKAHIGFAQEQEDEADCVGIEMMNKAGELGPKNMQVVVEETAYIMDYMKVDHGIIKTRLEKMIACYKALD